MREMTQKVMSCPVKVGLSNKIYFANFPYTGTVLWQEFRTQDLSLNFVGNKKKSTQPTVHYRYRTNRHQIRLAKWKECFWEQ
jgi:hypothetical protein